MPPPWESYSSVFPPRNINSTVVTRLTNHSDKSLVQSCRTQSPQQQQQRQRGGISEIVDGVERISAKLRNSPPTQLIHSSPPPTAADMNRQKQPAAKLQPQHAQITGEGVPTFKLAGSTPAHAPHGQNFGTKSKRWTIDQLRATDAMIPSQMGTNQFASQKGMTGFGTPRNTTTPVLGGVEGVVPEPVIPLQYGTNQFASQKGMTGFGSPRDVSGKHLHRIWELEYPEYAQANLEQAAH